MSDSKKYIEEYNKLKNIADALPKMDEPDVDKIIPMLTEGFESYSFLKQRIKDGMEKLEELKKLHAFDL